MKGSVKMEKSGGETVITLTEQGRSFLGAEREDEKVLRTLMAGDRPEVTAPFGIKYPVLAWSQGFERLAMLRWGLKDIRDLYVTDMDMLRQSPIF